MYKFINLDYMEMMTEGDDEMKQTMLEMLLAELPEELQKLHDYHAAGDWRNVNEVSHKMKSSLAFVGSDEFSDTNKEIEKIAKYGDGYERVPALLVRLEAVYQQVMPELQSELEKI